MTAMISIVGLLAFFGLGAFTLYILIELLDYIKRFHGRKWQEISFERPFGMPQDDFYFYPIRPMRFIPFLFSPDNIGDSTLADYKNKIKIALGVLLLMLIIFFVSSCIG